MYAALDIDSKLLLGVRVSRWRGTRPASAFLFELKERHDPSKAEFLVDGMRYLNSGAKAPPSRSASREGIQRRHHLTIRGFGASVGRTTSETFMFLQRLYSADGSARG